jgi:hypothetical protein
MKKPEPIFTVFFAILSTAICALAFFSCEKESLHCSVSNNSSYAVSFQFRSVYTDEFALQPGETKVYDSLGNPDVKYFKVNGISQNEKRKQVEYHISHRDAEFVNFSPIVVNVYNTLSISAKLSADGYMETEPMSIGGSENNKVNAIYTRTPNFSVTTDSYPAITDYEIKDGIMYVIIR